MKDLIILDLETTGVDPETDKIIEIGAVKIKDLKVKEDFTTLIDPKRPLSPEIERITGIREEDLKKAPTIEEVIPKLEKFLEDFPLVAHNKDFDQSFLEKEGLSRDFGDTLELSCLLLPLEKKHTLEYLLEKFCPKGKENHRALNDAYNLYQLYLFLYQRFLKMDERLKKEIREVLEETKWDFKSLLEEKSEEEDDYLTPKAEKRYFAPQFLKEEEGEEMPMAHLLSFLFYTESGDIKEIPKWVRKKYDNFFKRVKIKRCQENFFFNGHDRLF